MRDGTRFSSTCLISPAEPTVPTISRPSEYRYMPTAESEESISPTAYIQKTSSHQSSSSSCQLPGRPSNERRAGNLSYLPFEPKQRPQSCVSYQNITVSLWEDLILRSNGVDYSSSRPQKSYKMRTWACAGFSDRLNFYKCSPNFLTIYPNIQSSSISLIVLP
ncbi:hypothetical protein FGO68_gene11766 [Halteria grandinella]|uniref:Uncharacterized protein n=1 Tax=Halteria grandinella TaxID=5974 RepID=A0A8J8NVE9_HALGN|nr:hypothetical protein FGO68_gene11766 [Halteria grandinella]